jgi:hypothetical protein
MKLRPLHVLHMDGAEFPPIALDAFSPIFAHVIHELHIEPLRPRCFHFFVKITIYLATYFLSFVLCDWCILKVSSEVQLDNHCVMKPLTL